MGKINRVQSGLLIAALGIVPFSALPIQAAIRQYPRQSVAEINSTYLALSWGDIWEWLRRTKSTGGSRGPEKPPICMMVPGGLYNPETNKKIAFKVWNDRPLFLWQREMLGIEVRHGRSNRLIWSQSLKSNQTSIIYAGEPLQSGQVYFWRESGVFNELSPKLFFKIMDAEESVDITAELEELESRFKAEEANEEKIRLERVNFFVENKLWADALREIYSIPNPSPKLIEMRKKIQAHDFCPELGR